MTRDSMPGPDIPALVLIGIVLLWLPPVIEVATRWAHHVIPAKVVFLGW